MRNQSLYLWRDHLLTKIQLKEILSKEEWKEYWSNDCKICKKIIK